MSKLLEALQKVRGVDLLEIDARIQSLEAELSGLKAARSVVAARLGLPAGRGKAAHRKQPVSVEPADGHVDVDVEVAEPDCDEGSGRNGATTLKAERLEKIYKHITANGPTRQVVLMKELGIPAGSMGALVKHLWFTVLPDGRVDIARTGGCQR